MCNPKGFKSEQFAFRNGGLYDNIAWHVIRDRSSQRIDKCIGKGGSPIEHRKKIQVVKVGGVVAYWTK